MSRETGLPDGVPPDNAASGRRIEVKADYVAPDTATSSFVERSSGDAPNFAEAAKAPRRDLMSREHQNLTLLIAVVALAMAIGGVLLLRTPKSEMAPVCSSQPEWNQFNCRAG